MADLGPSVGTPLPLASLQPVERRTSRTCIASLVLGLLNLVTCTSFIFGIPALILGIVGLVQTRHRPTQLGGAGLAIAGIVMGGLTVLTLPLMDFAPTKAQEEKTQAAVCREAQREMTMAVSRWAAANGKRTGDQPTEADLIGPDKYLTGWPDCPVGSEGPTHIKIPKAGDEAVCSNAIPTHRRQ